MSSSLHGAEACCREVDFAPANHREKREMAEKEITTRPQLNQDFPEAPTNHRERRNRDSYKKSILYPNCNKIIPPFFYKDMS